MRVVKSPDVSPDVIRSAADSLASDYPNREELRAISGQISFPPNVAPTLAAQGPTAIGVIMRSADQKWVAQFRLDGITLSRLEQYTSWEDLRTRSEKLWKTYFTVARPATIIRVACRFINRIPMPQGATFDRTFTSTFSMPPSLPQTVGAYLLRLVVPFEEADAVAIITQALPENSQDCTFDIDAFVTAPSGMSEDLAWKRLESLRDIKNRIFFDSLTTEALERFR